MGFNSVFKGLINSDPYRSGFQVSDYGNFRITCDVPRAAAFCTGFTEFFSFVWSANISLSLVLSLRWLQLLQVWSHISNSTLSLDIVLQFLFCFRWVDIHVRCYCQMCIMFPFSNYLTRVICRNFSLWRISLDSIITTLLLLLLLLIYFGPLVIRWLSPGQSISQREIKAIYPSTLRMMCAVLISVIFYSSLADGWPGSNLRFWSKPFLIFPNTPITAGTIFVLTFHILLTWISRSLYLLSFSLSFLSFLLEFVSIAMTTSILSIYHAVLYQYALLVLFDLW